MSTRKSVATILDQAADILEKRGFVTSMCWDPESGGYCALGAIARAAYPKAKNAEIDDIAYYGVGEDSYDHDPSTYDPRYKEAVIVAAQTIVQRKDVGNEPAVHIYHYNDRAKSPKLVVKMLRRSADAARKAAA